MQEVRGSIPLSSTETPSPTWRLSKAFQLPSLVELRSTTTGGTLRGDFPPPHRFAMSLPRSPSASRAGARPRARGATAEALRLPDALHAPVSGSMSGFPCTPIVARGPRGRPLRQLQNGVLDQVGDAVDVPIDDAGGAAHLQHPRLLWLMEVVSLGEQLVNGDRGCPLPIPGVVLVPDALLQAVAVRSDRGEVDPAMWERVSRRRNLAPARSEADPARCRSTSTRSRSVPGARGSCSSRWELCSTSCDQRSRGCEEVSARSKPGPERRDRLSVVRNSVHSGAGTRCCSHRAGRSSRGASCSSSKSSFSRPKSICSGSKFDRSASHKARSGSKSIWSEREAGWM